MKIQHARLERRKFGELWASPVTPTQQVRRTAAGGQHEEDQRHHPRRQCPAASSELASGVSAGVLDSARKVWPSRPSSRKPSAGRRRTGPGLAWPWGRPSRPSRPDSGVAGARLPGAVGVGVPEEVAGGLADGLVEGLVEGLTVGVAEPWRTAAVPAAVPVTAAATTGRRRRGRRRGGRRAAGVWCGGDVRGVHRPGLPGERDVAAVGDGQRAGAQLGVGPGPGRSRRTTTVPSRRSRAAC